MILNSLRGRIALAAAAAVTVVILLGGALVTFFLSEAERDGLDERLAEQTDAVADTVREKLAANSPLDTLALPSERTDVGTAVRVFENGTERFAVGDLSTELPHPNAVGYQTIRSGVQSWRLYVTSVDYGGATYFIEAAVPTTVTEQLISEVRARVFYVAVVCAVLSGVMGWAFGGVASRPISQLRAAAERVSRSADLSVRAPTELGPLEVEDLARSVNVMLARLQEASRSTEQALQSSRAFAGNAAHEMRTPLTSMQANLDILARNPDLAADQRNEILASVISEQDRLTRLLDALHTLARGDVIAEAQLDIMDLADLVGVAVDSASRRHPEVTFRYDVPAAFSELRGWSDGLRVLVDNLLTNAVRHGDSVVKVTVDSKNDDLLLIVEDNGPGIPADERQHVFARFYRGRDVKSAGSGLGLALVAQQARIHGGLVGVEDSELGGAKFVVRLHSIASAP